MQPGLSPSSHPWILCLLKSSDSKPNLGYFPNNSSPCVPYLSHFYRSPGNLPLHLLHLTVHIDPLLLILPPEYFSCLGSLMPPPLSTSLHLTMKSTPYHMLSGLLQGISISPTTATRISKNFNLDISFPCLKSSRVSYFPEVPYSHHMHKRLRDLAL